MQGHLTESGLWAARGGSGARLIVLLHGLGATAAVWHGVAAEIERRGAARWLAPDLRGHGRSCMTGPFGFGLHAADVATLIADEDSAHVTLLGHSFGGVVAALLAGGLFGPLPARTLALGVKQDWSDDDIAGAHALAQRPQRVFATRAEAQERHAKVSGLFGLVPAQAPELDGGIRETANGFALAMNPGVYGAVGPSLAPIFDAARGLRMAAGADDPMTSLPTMQRHDPDAVLLAGLPHNAHVADPAKVVDLVFG